MEKSLIKLSEAQKKLNKKLRTIERSWSKIEQFRESNVIDESQIINKNINNKRINMILSQV